jgi:Protein of unknown function (DUF3800)
MYLMYVDESGDPGHLPSSPTTHFVLSGLTIHERNWKPVLSELTDFRLFLRHRYGLKLREELHAAALLSKPGPLARIPKHERLEMMRLSMDWLARRPEIQVTSVVVDKRGKTQDIFELAWRQLIQRFETTIWAQNLPGPCSHHDRGMLLPDNTNGARLTQIMRQMRHFNPINHYDPVHGFGYRDIKLEFVIEDPFMKDSASSHLHQMADVVAFFARQMYQPNAYVQKKYASQYYQRLHPILNYKASKMHPLGIVLR